MVGCQGSWGINLDPENGVLKKWNNIFFPQIGNGMVTIQSMGIQVHIVYGHWKVKYLCSLI